jgi:predicted RNA-binding Zn ribbon-like protein
LERLRKKVMLASSESPMTRERPPALFVADAVGLDFLNSIATPADTTIDWLDTGDGLIRWIKQAGLAPAKALTDLRSRALPGELDSVAAQARGLREWFRGFVLEHKGRPLASSDLAALEPLNRLLARDEAFQQIVVREPRGATALELRATRRWRSAESLLLPIGLALAKCLTEEDFSDVKSCEGAGCTLVFADHTRARARRWCSMAICGNRAKVAAHRERRKVADG